MTTGLPLDYKDSEEFDKSEDYWVLKASEDEEGRTADQCRYNGTFIDDPVRTLYEFNKTFWDD